MSCSTVYTPHEVPLFRVVVLLCHALVELSVAVLMWFAPTVFFAAPDAELLALARSFGVGAGSVGLLSLLLVPWGRGHAGFVGALTLAAYQLGIFATQLIRPMDGVPVWVAPVFHGSFVICFLVLAARARSEAHSVRPTTGSASTGKMA